MNGCRYVPIKLYFLKVWIWLTGIGLPKVFIDEHIVFLASRKATEFLTLRLSSLKRVIKILFETKIGMA